MSRILIIDASDNIAVALEPAEKGNTLVLPDGRQITALDAIPFAHKIAIVSLAEQAPVVKYGEVIGLTTRAIQVGEHVHIHNMKSQQS
jgi:diadenosine tetraphosphate (Ap4A) HIT family hydrolase